MIYQYISCRGKMEKTSHSIRSNPSHIGWESEVVPLCYGATMYYQSHCSVNSINSRLTTCVNHINISYGDLLLFRTHVIEQWKKEMNQKKLHVAVSTRMTFQQGQTNWVLAGWLRHYAVKQQPLYSVSCVKLMKLKRAHKQNTYSRRLK